MNHSRRRKALSLVAAGVTAIMAAAIITITGDAARRSSDLLASLRDPTSRSVVLRSSNPTKPIPAALAKTLASLRGIELAIAVTTAETVTAPSLHDPNASATYLTTETLRGNLPLTITTGKKANLGEVLMSPSAAVALRMTQPLATVISTKDRDLPVVGTFDLGPAGALSGLLGNAVVGPSSAEASGYLSVVFLAREPADTGELVRAINLLIPDRDGISLEFEQRAAQIQQTVATAGATNVASLTLTIILVGGLIQLASALLNSLLQRRENARRRALGFTRTEIIALGIIEAALVSLVGAVVGTVAATARLARFGTVAKPGQALATLGFLTLLAMLAAIPGGANAALQDPARILRIP
jgi:putative ABC transport system permease protein